MYSELPFCEMELNQSLSTWTHTYADRLTYLDAISTRNSIKYWHSPSLTYTNGQSTQMSKYWHSLGDDDAASELNRLTMWSITCCRNNYTPPRQCVILHAKVDQKITVHVKPQTQI